MDRYLLILQTSITIVKYRRMINKLFGTHLGLDYREQIKKATKSGSLLLYRENILFNNNKLLSHYLTFSIDY